MSLDSDDESKPLENVEELMDTLEKGVTDLYTFKDYFFENHPLEMAKEKSNLLSAKKDDLMAKFDSVNESQIPMEYRAKYLYLKGRTYNSVQTYDPKALECLSKAVKLQPQLIDAWNELGECYWKNLNIKEARACLEGALKQQRNRFTLRSLSILLRQECGGLSRKESTEAMQRSLEYAKEAVAQDPTDGVSWSVLGNAYLCLFFLVSQQKETLKLCQSAYKQAWNDPVARAHPDLHYNKGIVLKYEEKFQEALDSFVTACRLDPPWSPPNNELKQLVHYLKYVNDLVHTKGRIKVKRIQQLVKSMDTKFYGEYEPGSVCTFGQRKVYMEHARLDQLVDGENEGKVVMGRVVGSIHNDSAVPFTFAIVDESMTCMAINVYNWADGRGVIIGDCVVIAEPKVATHTDTLDIPNITDQNELAEKFNDKKNQTLEKLTYNFRSIRLNSPTFLLVNGKKIGREQFASTQVTSMYEAH